jgi:sialate O-acetylesterase
MRCNICLASLLLVTTLIAPALVRADVKPASVFASHMVLQRDLAVPVWGTAVAGEEVTVAFRDQKKTVTAGVDGKWSVKLDPLTAGGPDVLSISGKNSVSLEDVLVGEVWVGSGQSNMAGAASGYAKDDDVLASNIVAGPYPKLRLYKSPGNAWLEATPKNIEGFSALHFSFGLRLQKELNVPVGLIQGAVGGTPSGMWLSEGAFLADAASQELNKEYAQGYDALAKKYEEDVARWKEAAKAAEAKGEKAPPAPRAPLKPGETTGGKVGRHYEQFIRPVTTYGIRGVLWDQGESGTQVGGVDQCTMMGALIRGWRKDWGQGDFPFLYVQKPSGGGCAWDPGNPITRRAEAFTPLPTGVPSDGQYIENHIAIMKYSNTGMATSSDLGSGVHPVNKSGYGHRAADVALGMVYGKSIEYLGPVYDKHEVNGANVRVTFKHANGLAWKHGGKLQGFAIAGEDKVFHWADATIDGKSVVLSSEKVANPVAVRYAFASRRPWANLFNAAGLPALTFRTDSW